MARDFSEDGAYGAGISGVAGADPSTTGGQSAPTMLATTPLMPQPAQSDQNNANSAGLAGMSDSGGSFSGSAPSGGFGSSAPTKPAWNGSTSDINHPQLGGYQDTTGLTPWGAQFLQNTGGMSRHFASGGAIDTNDDPNATDPMGSAMGAKLQQSINQSLSVVQDVLSYGRQKHGITGGGQQQAMNDEGFRQSDNVEDRRDNDQTDPNDRGTPLQRRVNNRVDEVSNAYNSFKGGFNKMSQDAGINDIKSSPVQPQGDDDDDSRQPYQRPTQAIQTDEEPQ